MIVKAVDTIVAWHGKGFPLIQGMEDTPWKAKSAQSAARGSRFDSDDQPQQPALGCTAHSRRVAETGHRNHRTSVAKYMVPHRKPPSQSCGPSWTASISVNRARDHARELLSES